MAVPEHLTWFLKGVGQWNTRRTLMEELKLLNVTREVLLPSVDESARAVTKLHG